MNKFDLVTIGDSMKDIFVFPCAEQMRQPVLESKIDKRISGSDKFMLLEYGGKITVDKAEYSIGGTACNVACGVAKLGIRSSIISKIGDDNEGIEVLDELEKANVDTGNIETVKDRKTSFSVIISQSGDRSILVYHSFKPQDFSLDKNLSSDWLFIGPMADGYGEIYKKATALASEKNLKIAINPGAVQIKDGPRGFGGLLSVTKVLFVNRQEGQDLADFSGLASPKDIVKALLKMGVETVVLTDGRQGAYAGRGEDFYKISIYPGERVEATGAGDAFASAFLAAHIKGEKIFECLKWGVTNSASVVSEIGAQKGQLNLTSLKKKMRDYHWPPESLRFS